jgi:hypothetical protein
MAMGFPAKINGAIEIFFYQFAPADGAKAR